VKPLIDENLPDALVDVVSARFPGSAHVKQLSLTTTDDDVIWRFARDNGFALLTQDSDFERKAAQRGAPPKVILVRTGNIRTPLLRPIVAAQLDRIERFLASATERMMYLPRPRSLWSGDDPAL
jgi:predicted nuclease of predicted toxin-antitoxin system